MKNILFLVVAAVLGGVVSLTGFQYLNQGQTTNNTIQNPSPSFTKQVNYSNYNGEAIPTMDFTIAADRTLPVVVHITASKKAQNNNPYFNPFDRGQDQAPQRQGSGSGVIISEDGYIATNNHVIDNATELLVTLNDNRSYNATVVGTDPSTDIALLKIDAYNLKHVRFANSDEVKVGQWVVAVGNPFNLASTVTAGIVSAKGRNLNMVKDNAPIESFIQTDAAVNPGNSGGALVNLRGELVGINTAIASPTGTFAGYSFAVPSNIVVKVIEDIKDYGVVQRAFLGVMIRDVDAYLADQLALNTNEGVYIDSLMVGGSAAYAGLRVGDVITKVDGYNVSTSSELIEKVGQLRPGDQVAVTVLRGQREKNVRMTLRNRNGNVDIINKDPNRLDALGAAFEELTDRGLRQLGLRNGLRVKSLERGKLREATNIKEGFIITRLNNLPINSIDDVKRFLKQNTDNRIMIEGKYPNQRNFQYHSFEAS